MQRPSANSQSHRCRACGPNGLPIVVWLTMGLKVASGCVTGKDLGLPLTTINGFCASRLIGL